MTEHGTNQQQPQQSVIDVFLCHNSADKPWVEKLAEQIESETVDGTADGRPLRVFFDKWDIDIGQNFVQRINHGLSQSRFVAVVISPEFLAAPWTEFEWTHIVAADPTNIRMRLIPIFRREHALDGSTTCDLPAPFRALNWVDFRRETEFRKSFQRLIRRVRGLPPERGKKRRPIASLTTSRPLPAVENRPSAAPDAINDLILSNLLPVTDFPYTIWSAPTSARVPKDVWSQVPDPPGYLLRSERLYTFSDLSTPKNSLRAVVDARDVKGEPISIWRSDPAKWAWYVEILNRCLGQYLGSMGIRSARGYRYFFKGPKEGDTRSQKNGDDPARDVAAKKINSVDGSIFWVHHGAELRFMTLGESLFLAVEPTYVFTSDGRTPLSGPRVTPLSMKWGGKERNASILRHVVFWARTLGRSRSKIDVPTGGKPITIAGIPALSRTTFGIEFDHIGLRTLIAQVDDELGDVAKSLEGSLQGLHVSPDTENVDG